VSRAKRQSEQDDRACLVGRGKQQRHDENERGDPEPELHQRHGRHRRQPPALCAIERHGSSAKP